MPTQPPDPMTPSATPLHPDAARPRRPTNELVVWLRERGPRLAEEWSAELRVKWRERSPCVDGVVGEFLAQLVALLPLLCGPRGEAVQPLWARSCELFGTLAAKRGLAAGEVIEEFQVLRELLIRDLYEMPLPSGVPPMRDALRLSRAVDRGVTHASVGHTDAMFFDLLEPQGAAGLVSAEEAAKEASAELRVIRDELQEALGGPLPDLTGSTEH
jgi:hypothetical protein